MRLNVVKTMVTMLMAACISSASAQTLDHRSSGRVQTHVDQPGTSGDHSDTGRNTGTEAQQQLLTVDLESTTPVVCLKKARIGSRIAIHRCKSLADWKTEYASEYLKRYLLEM